MKKLLLISLLFSACSQQPDNKKAITKAKEEQQNIKPVNKFPNIAFASKKDLSCGMPLSAGVEDTAHYKGAIYGFCSAECKDSFLKDPEKYLAKK